jgi:hypothetical protein
MEKFSAAARKRRKAHDGGNMSASSRHLNVISASVVFTFNVPVRGQRQRNNVLICQAAVDNDSVRLSA